jgi:hypothetical protein
MVWRGVFLLEYIFDVKWGGMQFDFGFMILGVRKSH